MLLFIAIIGFVYVMPNLYSEYPVVQVSSELPMVAQELKAEVIGILSKAHIAHQGIAIEDDRMEIRFASTDTQLLARDVIKKGLGNAYTVALNLVPSTPSWLRAIHAEPMKQGLDLRGGVHFLLEVDIESVVNRRYEGMMKSIGQDLREAGIRYAGVRYVPEKGVNIRFRTAEGMDDALSELRQKSSGYTVTQVPDSFDLMASLSPSELNGIRQNTIEQTMSILRNRVNELGVGEAIVQQQGATRVAVDLPGIQVQPHYSFIWSMGRMMR